MSFLDNSSWRMKKIIAAEYAEIGKVLVENWVNTNLDEGQFYADWRFADMAISNFIKSEFNLFYDLKPNDECYLECEGE